MKKGSEIYKLKATNENAKGLKFIKANLAGAFEMGGVGLHELVGRNVLNRSRCLHFLFSLTFCCGGSLLRIARVEETLNRELGFRT